MIKKFIPSIIKRKFKNAIQNVINNDGRTAQLEKKINRLSILINSLYPENIIYTDEMETTFRNFCKRNNIQSLNKNIAKNDLMFHYVLFVFSNLNKTLEYYLNKGYNQTELCYKLMKAYIKDEPETMLDFACGHGNQTRFFVNKFSPEAITVSDIKESAVEFQKKEFGVRGQVSSYVPENFKVDKKFDFILVSSLFSHLNEDLFVRWLKVLYNLVSDKGILAFSTHDIVAFQPHRQKEEFIYETISEDMMFFEFEDSITDTVSYGSTFISEKYFFKLLEKASIPKGYCVRYAQLWEGQDLYILAKRDIAKIEIAN